MMRKGDLKAWLLAALLLGVASPALAEVRILASPGGEVGHFSICSKASGIPASAW